MVTVNGHDGLAHQGLAHLENPLAVASPSGFADLAEQELAPVQYEDRPFGAIGQHGADRRQQFGGVGIQPLRRGLRFRRALCAPQVIGLLPGPFPPE